MKITKEMKQKLAEMIVENIRANFRNKYVTKNLINTIRIYSDSSGNVMIDIPAEIYDIKEWKKNKAVVYSGGGSYANLVNTTGGFSKTHTNYVEKAIDEAISQWLNMIKSTVEQGKNFEWKVTKE